MSQHDPVSAAWRAHRAYLVDLAFRMVGDIGVAEDMVQEAFSRLLRAPVGDIDDERGWLIVVTSRLCLDHIKSASTRRERPQDIAAWHDGDASVSSVDPADRVTLDDEVRLALLIMLERLGPAERVVFVLHEIFGLPYQQIATTIGSQASTCRQLAHRARRKINESRIAASVEPAQHRVVTRAFIEACSNGDLDTLLEVLDPGCRRRDRRPQRRCRRGRGSGWPDHPAPLESPRHRPGSPAGVRSTGGAGLCQPSACRRVGPVDRGRQDHKNPCLSAAFNIGPVTGRTRRRLVRYRRYDHEITCRA